MGLMVVKLSEEEVKRRKAEEVIRRKAEECLRDALDKFFQECANNDVSITIKEKDKCCSNEN